MNDENIRIEEQGEELPQARYEGPDYAIRGTAADGQVLAFAVSTARMVEEARRRGYKKIVGEYLPTLKNQMVREHYDQLGFTKTDEKADGAKRYELNVDDYQPKECYIVKA